MASGLKPFEVPQSILETPGAFPVDSSELQTVGTSAPQSLSSAVRARKDEFTRKKSIKIKVGSWNVAALNDAAKDLGLWFVKGFGVKGLSDSMATLQPESSTNLPQDQGIESVEDQEARRRRKKITIPNDDKPAIPHDEDIGLYVLGLQEVIDISSVTEAIKPYTDPNPAKKWKTSLRSCLPKGYEKVAEQQLLGLLILVFASPELHPTISNVSCSSVRTGFSGYFGNKGAVSVRLVLGESTKMCFINCHLAAGADAASLEHRIWDTNQIIQRTRFGPVSIEGENDGPEEKLGDEDFAFWFGDLNYRLDDIPGEDVRRLLLLHTRNEYDVSNTSKQKIDSELGYQAAAIEQCPPGGPEPFHHYEISEEELTAAASNASPTLDPASDPASLVTTISSLFAHDQLRAQQRQQLAFHDGWREGDVNFLPTYKYDIGSIGMFDSGEKKRSPSWCDRILYRTRTDRLMYEERAAKETEARRKDEEMQKRGLDEAAEDERSVLFDYDPDTDGLAFGDDYDEEAEEVNDAELVRTREGREDEVTLEHYISHQRVLSSDHKPIDAVFTLTYDAVIPELKAKVHAEVARELDKAENEARPTITVVTENHNDGQSDAGDDALDASTDNINTQTASDVNCINFGNVRYDVPKTRSITVANTGQLSCTFKFIGRGDDSLAAAKPRSSNNKASHAGSPDNDIAPSWLTISPLSPSDPDLSSYSTPDNDYTLSPGDTLTLYLTAHVDSVKPSLVEALNSGTTALDDVLILRVAGGRDHFLPVRGTWLPTCFFRSLEELVVAPPAGGVRAAPRKRNNRDGTGTSGVKSSPTSMGGQGRNSAPRELFALTEAVQVLAERAVVDWGMVHPDAPAPWTWGQDGDASTDGSITGWPFNEKSWTFHAGEERDEMKARVREALDTAKPIQDCLPLETECIVRLEVVGETLVEFLASVRSGIVTTDMWKSISTSLEQLAKQDAQGSPAEDKSALTMEALSSRPVHSVSLTFVTFMLSRLLQEVAPLSKEQKGKDSNIARSSSRRSRASTVSEAESEISTGAAPSVESGNAGSNAPAAAEEGSESRRGGGGFFSSITRRRRRGLSNATGGTKTAAKAEAMALEKRTTLLKGYAANFAPLVIRTEGDMVLKGKEKKALEVRKQKLMETLLEGVGV